MSGGNEAIHQFGERLIGVYSVALSVLLIAALLWVWPERPDASKDWTPLSAPEWAGGKPIGADTRLLLVVVFMGALGSSIHAATSFASFVGNKRLVLSWTWWYLLRPFIGASLAVLFYFVIRGGFLSANGSATDISIFGVAAISGLAGMFSKQATDKLRELFDNLFKTENGQGDDARSDKLAGAQPITDIMIERRKISAVIIPDGKTPADTKIRELHRMLGGVITRVPVFSHDYVARCVVHQSLVYKFLADRSMASATGDATFDPDNYTLQDLLDDPGMKEWVQDSIAFIPETATLADAKKIMDGIDHCQDAFVTKNGDPAAPVVGWVTDAEVRRKAAA